MKLWLLEQTENSGYDTFDSAVVAAETVEEAQQISPSGNWTDERWASSPANVKVEYIGIAKETMKQGVILSSYNGG